MGTNGARLHAVETFAGESKEQEFARRRFIDTASAQIEQSILRHLADGGAVSAFHVVGVDFQLRLGIKLRVVRQQQIAIGLLGVGFLSVFVDDDAAVKYAVRVPIENAVIKLAASAMRLGVALKIRPAALNVMPQWMPFPAACAGSRR